jgi:hypothetical protein
MMNLHSTHPTWLELAHKKLDEAVFAAYGWPSDCPMKRKDFGALVSVEIGEGRKG